MLSISLSKNEAIVVGAGIVVTVLEVCGDEVRLCIERSEDVSPEQAEVCVAVAETAGEPATSSWCPRSSHVGPLAVMPGPQNGCIRYNPNGGAPLGKN